MRKYFSFLIAIMTITSLCQADNAPVEKYFQGRLPKTDGRYPTFTKALNLMSERNVKTIIETGTARCGDTNFDGDGGSTILFSHWACDNGATMISVDNSERHIDIAKKAASNYLSNLSFFHDDSINFLQNFEGTIDFLYLDSYDYNENNPGPPQIHCLREILAAFDKLTDDSIVMIDDCNIPGGGKGKLAIAFLVNHGWKKCINRHQVILLKK